MKYHQQKLNNGLDCLFVNLPGSTVGSVQIWFRAGSALENHDNEGIAHFLEHMFFKGTSTRPGAKIAHDVESYGGEINAFTSFDYTCYYINTPQSKLPNSIETIMDMVSNPLFTNEDLVPERGVVFEEFRRSIDNPGHYNFHRIQETSFTGGYAHAVLGREDTIKNFTREQLIDFRKNFYNLSNTLLVVAGDLKENDSLIKLIEGFELPKGPASHFGNFKLQSEATTDLHQKDVRMCTLTLSLQAPRFDDAHAPAEDLAMNCLGTGETSKLYKKLVLENSLANSSSTSTMFMNDGGAHFIRVTFPYKNYEKVTSKLLLVLQETLTSGIKSDELQKIKNYYLSSKVYEKESIEAFTFGLGQSFAQTGDIHSDELFIKKVEGTTLESVNYSLGEIFKRAIHTSMQIPRDVDLKKAQKSFNVFHKKIQTLRKSIPTKKVENHILTSKHDSQVKVLTLKPGVNLIYRQNTMTPTFSMHAYLRGGISSETAATNGSYHLMSHLLTKGHNEISHDKMKKEIEEASASLVSFSGKNAYGITLHGQSKDFKNLASHLLGSLLAPDMLDTKMKHEKEMMLRQIDAQKEDPTKQCFSRVSKLMFNNHPYSLNAVGTPQTIKKFTRKSMLAIHNKNLKKEPLLITYCGDLHLEEVLSALSPHLEKISPRANVKPKLKKYKPILGKKVVMEFNREQTQIFIGTPIVGRAEEEHLVFKMIAAHLSGMSSELFVEVRDKKGLCYSTQAIHFNAVEGGYFGIYMASGHEKVSLAIEAINEILNNLKKNGFTKEQFDRIKTMVEGQNQLALQTNDDYANIYSVPVLQHHGLDQFHDNTKKIKDYDYETFQKQVKRLLSAKFSTVLVGKGANKLA